MTTKPTAEVSEIEEHEMTPFESQLAQAILGALEHRGFNDCGKYLDTSLIEHIRPLLQTHTTALKGRMEQAIKDEIAKYPESHSGNERPRYYLNEALQAITNIT